jgi:RNA recognition motif-containing protein
LKEYFESRFCQIKDCVIILDKNTNHPRGFGFITLNNPEKVSEILRTQPHFIKGKKIDCKIAIPKEFLENKKSKKKHYKKKKEGKGSSSDSSSGSKNSNKSIPLYMRKMFVGGLHPNLTINNLLSYFSQFGKIENGVIMTDKNTGKSRGFGFIIFKEKETIDKIISYSNCHFLYGKWIECKRTKPKSQNIKMINDNNKNPIVNYYKNLTDESKKNILFKNDITNNNNNINNEENSIIENNNNNNNYENNVIINNYFAKKGQALYGDKHLNDKNLFIYQNYIPRKQIKFFLNNNNLEGNENKIINSDNKILNNLNKEENNNNNINELKTDIKFQNYFNNNLVNPLTYNYFHYKLFDSHGDELSKLKHYDNSTKLSLFQNKNNLNNKNTLNDININNNNLNDNNNNNNNEMKNKIIDNNKNMLNNNNNCPKLFLFNEFNKDNNLEKYQNKKEHLFEKATPIKINFDNKYKDDINNKLKDNNNNKTNNNILKFGPDRNSLKRKRKYKKLLGNNENYQPY